MNRRFVRTLVLSCAVLTLGTGVVSAATVTMNGVIDAIRPQAGTFTFTPDGNPSMELTASPQLLRDLGTGSWVQVEIDGQTAQSISPIAEPEADETDID